MKQTIRQSDFRDAFRKADRADQFSYEGLEVLFNYLEDLEQDLGEEIELDVIALCCDYVEDDIETILENHNIDSIEKLSENTLVLFVSEDRVIYQVY